MRRGDRLFEIIEIIRSAQKPISAARIAEELSVVKRTVYRDVATLIAQGVPIQGEAGVGYVLEPGFHMPPLMLTPNEIAAAVLGAQWVQTRGEPELARAAEKLIAKIAAVSPDHAQMSFVAPPTSVAPVSAVPEPFEAGDMRRAIHSRVKVRIGYKDDNGAITERVIWPILLGYRDEGRILAAWCELRAGFRYFRTERITGADVLDARIPRRMDILRAEWRTAMDAERLGFESREHP
ncbi:YafY family protein [Sulfitobacter sp. 20_GPM-1509m]|uniref:helix-turn-helix transcriptional regulator n=1 Tax=Sulfitobacter sp. 20_GPM-1509m TaxID=1380367 RepID=UPI00048C1912|nr:YafY family protein [Sulfitobacter sp. 20_GPM-1509m]